MVEFKKKPKDFFDILYTESRCTIVHGLDFRKSKLSRLPSYEMKKVAENIVSNYIGLILDSDFSIFQETKKEQSTFIAYLGECIKGMNKYFSFDFFQEKNI
ncbi:MAG: hypothetical protein WAW59_05955 [Patescibacteria group bacterium]